jgi:hypothetical protein
MRYWDTRQGKTLQKFGTNRYQRNGLRMGGAMAMIVIYGGLLVACDRPAPVAVAAKPVKDESSRLACGQDGRLTVDLYGSIRASIDWRAGEMSCTGMPRPDGVGARVRLSGPLDTNDDGKTLAFILGLPDLEAGQAGNELATTVTLIEEGNGRFYRTRDASDCWTDVASQQPIGAISDQLYSIEGTLYCVSPLAELNGSTSVNFTELKFTGHLNWKRPE